MKDNAVYNDTDFTQKLVILNQWYPLIIPIHCNCYGTLSVYLENETCQNTHLVLFRSDLTQDTDCHIDSKLIEPIMRAYVIRLMQL